MYYPKTLTEMMSYFKKLPGIGEKSAERLALALLSFSDEEVLDFSKVIVNGKKKLKTCSICGNLTEEKECSICTDKTRKQNLICVVEDYKSIFVFEKMGNFRGVYHVLEGLISPIDGIGPDDIKINELVKRCRNICDNLEIIIALKPSIEGETTSKYIKKILGSTNICVYRLSYGIPIGADIDYLDALTLERAFKDKKIIE